MFSTNGRMKRLRSRKERSQMRAGGKGASKSKTHHHHHCHRQRSKDMAYFQNCCHSSCHCASRRNAPFPNVIPVPQEPSIITDRRLIGHHGLFNHEVKSIDVERLLSEQRKLGKSGRQGQEKNNSSSRPSSTSHVPSLFVTHHLLGADTDEVLPFKEKTAHANCRKKEEKISQGSDLTPGQRPQKKLDLSSERFKSVSSSKHSSDVVIIKSKKTKPLMSEKGKDSQLTPTVVKENVKILNRKAKGHISSVEHTPKNQESPVHQTQARGLSPSPVLLSSSDTVDSFDIQRRRQDARCASKSVSAVAAGLCDCLQFPLLRRRNLVAESREVLLKALRERHGPRLQENLLEVQRGLSFGVDPTKKVQVQEPTMIDELLPPAFQADTASQPCYDSQKTTSFKMMGSRPFKSRPEPHQTLEQTADWFRSPVETSVSLLDDILRPTCAPQFCMEFEPSGAF
ncbi:proline-rich protein 19 isoform X2 [Cebidichthys violaceus]|uniref:proline-rich protein 19 isoform X2 n=1 Tax=Cebidichthys violaceus TaxID=271503 RepID=UPI0035CC3537